MIILPERGLPKGKLLLPQRRREWQQPSQRSSIYGPQNFNQWQLTARTDDGHIIWRGWFDDREDADAFLYSLISGSLYYEKDLWRLPNPWWPGLDPHLTYDFAGARIIVTTSAANQTDNVPTDWNNTSNRIDTIAGGGSGAAALDSTGAASATGGGGGAWSQQTSVTLTPGGTATFFLGGQVFGTVLNVDSTAAGNLGKDCWYNGATLAASSVGAKGGSGGSAGAPSLSGGAGGLASGGIGNTKFSGGNGGAASSSRIATGGGGAAGLNGAGGNGTDSGAGPLGTNGGTADNGFGGAGGAGATNVALGTTASQGATGTEYGTVALPFRGSSGGGGGAAANNGFSVQSGDGGAYGGGGGAAFGTVTQVESRSGGIGLIFLYYVPVFSSWDAIPQIPYRHLSKIKMVGY